jgi:hypothetical protein
MSAVACFLALLAVLALSPAAQQAAAPGAPIRTADKTGHVSNYDEARVGTYALPDPLTFASGRPVNDAAAWHERRAELIKIYERDIWGRIPERTPQLSWSAAPAETDHGVIVKRSVGRIGAGADAPAISLKVALPASPSKAVPLILLVQFGGGGAPVPDPPLAGEILARGWGWATVGYNDIQPDKENAFDQGVIGATSRLLAAPLKDDEWGDVSAWAWGVSRIIDYLATDPAIDAKRIALHGHSRIGKTALWASALDTRIAAVYASCPGEMGAALSRRDFGETVDDMAQRFPYWFDRNFQKWVGRWNDMPVDAHTLIALSAPRPVFVTGGSEDQWADPVGEFKALVAAGPVYRLLDRKDLGTTTLPALDTPAVDGDLGWYYHKGPHAATPDDWKVFLQFLDKYFH